MRSGLKLAAGVGGVALAGFGLVYLTTGRRELRSPFIPDSIEDQIDRAVAWLDRKLGKAWVDRGMDAIEAALLALLPGPVLALGRALYQAELSGRKRGWSGMRKLSYAVRLLG